MLIWLVVPPKQDSLWKRVGVFGSTVKKQPATQEPAAPEA